LLTKPHVDFVYFDAGGGHRSAALALQAVLEASAYDWTVRLVNLQEALDSLDVFRKVTGIRLQDLYNHALAKGWTLGSTVLLPIMHAIIRLYHPAEVRLLTEFWKKQRPDMVVSLVPNFNRALFQSLAASLPRTPLVTILTDFADYPPHFWMEKQNQYLICGTERSAAQAAEMGYDARHTMKTSGMILRPQFYERQELDRGEERKALGLHPGLPTGMVLFGGEGSNVMAAIAQRLGNSSEKLQLIMVCGKNESVRKRIQELNTRNKIVTEGFTRRVPYYMALSDFFIGKPGPGSISEAVKMGLPVIVEKNSWTLPQERYNADWVTEKGVGVVLENFRGIEPALKALLQTGGLAGMKERIAQLDNRAVFEIPPMLDKILAEHQAGVSGQECLG
jgi:UDP-N-acetylglucosamine:LPS N-acetylglucosamine transferase